MKWIKNRLPDTQCCIGAVKLKNGKVIVGEIYYDPSLSPEFRIIMGCFGWESGESDYYHINQLIAWMKFPEPPTHK